MLLLYMLGLLAILLSVTILIGAGFHACFSIACSIVRRDDGSEEDHAGNR